MVTRGAIVLLLVVVVAAAAARVWVAASLGSGAAGPRTEYVVSTIGLYLARE